MCFHQGVLNRLRDRFHSGKKKKHKPGPVQSSMAESPDPNSLKKSKSNQHRKKYLKNKTSHTKVNLLSASRYF